MFKRSSKNIVGRVVEVEGKTIDEDQSTDTKSKSSTSVVSRIFGASPYKKSSTTRTPGRKLLKKLICTPGKSRSFPDTSVSELDGIGTYIPNNNSTGLTVSRSTSSEETKETIGIQTNNFGSLPESPPKLARKLVEEDGANSENVVDTKPIMRSPMRAQDSHQIYNRMSSSEKKRVDADLQAALNHSDDMIFYTNSTSSDEFDQRNESNAMPRIAASSSSPFSSPQRQIERRSSPSKFGRNAMKSPGMSIPTPAVGRATSNDGNLDGFSGSDFPFPHPFQSSPMDKVKATTVNPKNLSTQFEDFEDDDAFLPDDFVAPGNKSKQNETTFTLEQVEQKMREARRQERLLLRQQHETEMEEKTSEFERVLLESGSRWKQDNDELEARYQKQYKDEQHKTYQKHHDLLNKTQALEDVMVTLKEKEAEFELLQQHVKNLEKSDQMNNSVSKNRELESLRKGKRNAEHHISELESELKHTVDPLKREKETADQKAAELSEQLRALTEYSDQSQTQLGEAMKEIALLKGQMAELPSADPEEIRTSTLEIENLRNLRAQDGKEIQALQKQLSEMVDEHQNAFTPKKKGSHSTFFDSPAVVGEVDMLRVNYDKAQNQLKGMGRLLKRYNTEREELKAKALVSEQLHIEAIKIAVTQATQDQKEKLKLLTEENEALKQKPKDIGEQMVEEMKNHMEDLKKRNEEDIVQWRGTLNDEIQKAEKQQKALRAQFETENNTLKSNNEKEVESLLQEIQELRSNQSGGFSLAKGSSKEEFGSLQSELRRLTIEFEKERTEIIERKSRECGALEDQIKSMNEMQNEELELIAVERREEVDSLKKKINELETELESKSLALNVMPSGGKAGPLTEDYVREIRSSFEDALHDAKRKAKSDEDRLLQEIDSLKEAKDVEAKKANEFEAQIVEIQAQSAARIEKVKSDYNRQINEVKSDHASESDDLLTQLDLIEAESAQRYQRAEKAAKEKDAIITALGSQLAESESRTSAISKNYDALTREIESLHSDLEAVTASNEARQEEIVNLIEQHKKETEEQFALRKMAVDEAREDMISLAEGQLAERQATYQAVKRELDNAQSRISVLERDLRFAKKELEEMKRRHEAREADLRDELAQSKAAIATKEADRARAEKIHQAELDLAREAETEMKTKFEESQATSRSVQKTLATLVTEKQRLEQELAEVTAISEELATLCEKNKLM